MYWTFNNFNDNMLYQNTSRENVQNTFKAFVDAIIPRSPGLAELYGEIQYYGALDLHIDEYLLLSLNSLIIPLGIPVAALSPIARLQAVHLLLQPTEYSSELPLASQNYQRDVIFSIMLINRLTMMGYYSEWSGYGTTRLNSPNQRILEYIPISWEQIGYPGPSLGYRASTVYNFTKG